MRDGKERADWIHTTVTCVAIRNSFRMDNSQKAVTFEELYPFSKHNSTSESVSDDVRAFEKTVAKAMFENFVAKKGANA